MMFSRLVAVLVAVSAAAIAQTPEVARVFKMRCAGCHGAAQQISGLRLDVREDAMKGGYSGPVIVPGKSADSKLIHRVTGKPGVLVMPPSGPRLTPAEIDLLTKWIDAGAKWESSGAPVQTSKAKHPHWAFQTITQPAEPRTKQSEWARNPVDAFILARLEKEGIAPSPEAEKRTLLRRVSFDLTGLPPTPEEMRAFLADSRADAFERVVDRLLSSPHFGERWARPWLDRARYADSDGYEKDWVRPWAWRYRDWVIRALNSDLPFDQFTVMQVAGDLMPDGGQDAKIAAGFNRNTLTNREGGIDNNQFLFEAAIDRSSTIGSAWLGLTVACAQCHDHKYDPISQKDFYSLYSFFENMQEVDTEAPLAGEIGPWLQKRDEYRGKRKALIDQYKVPELQAAWEKEMLRASAKPGERTDWDLAWDCLLKLTEGGADGERIMRIPLEKRTEREADTLTTHFIRNYHFAVGQKVWKEHKLDELDKKLKELSASYPQLSEVMTVADFPRTRPSHLRVRGDYRTDGIEVPVATPAVLPELNAKGAPTRLDLARWMVRKDNPLTARVTVNWVWQEIFGLGIVRTSDDFGTRGDAPSHPELLDWMSARFMDEGWSMKRLIRTIVTSSVYRQSSKVRPELQTTDPDNALLARQSRLRLPAELIRDEALFAGGLLTMEVGGRSVKPPQPAGVAAMAYGARGDDSWAESKGADRYRRGLYIHFQRATPYPLLMNFDAPKAVVTLCRRERSNTSLQALNLLNDPVFIEAATALAYRTLTEAPGTDERIKLLFEHALNRPPSLGEAERFRKGLATFTAKYAADAKLTRDLAPAELPGITRTEAAAWVNLATVLLNLDEFITKE